MSSALEQASQYIDHAQQLLDSALSFLKAESLVEGRVSGSKLDEKQLACFEVAYCEAEITAAKVMLGYGGKVESAKGNGKGPRIETKLALQYTAEALQNCRARFHSRRADFGLTRQQIQQVLDTDDVDGFINEYLSTAHMEAVGQEIVDHNGFIGDYMLDDEKEMMRDQFRSFADEVVMPLAEPIHTKDLDIPDDIIKPLVELGCFGLSIPMQYGGIQPDDSEDNLGMIVVTEELSRGSLGAAGSLITRPEIMARALLKGGTDEQKDYWLPRLAQADPLNAIAVTEPNYGSDVASMKVKATQVEGGWVLDGEKTWCTFAGRAGVLLTLARTNQDMSSGHKGLTMFMVEKPSFPGHAFAHEQPNGGTITGKAIPTIGYRGMHSFTVFFDNYFVPDSHVLGGEDGIGQGFYYTMAGFSGGRIQTAARAAGIMQAAFEKALSYACERVVFGKPIVQYQLTLVKLARMAMALLVSRQFTYHVARLMDEGKGQMEASLVKLYACKSSEWVCREALQIHGGMGYAEESSVSRYFIDSRVLSIFEGAEETLALKVIAKALVDKAK